MPLNTASLSDPGIAGYDAVLTQLYQAYQQRLPRGAEGQALRQGYLAPGAVPYSCPGERLLQVSWHWTPENVTHPLTQFLVRRLATQSLGGGARDSGCCGIRPAARLLPRRAAVADGGPARWERSAKGGAGGGCKPWAAAPRDGLHRSCPNGVQIKPNYQDALKWVEQGINNSGIWEMKVRTGAPPQRLARGPVIIPTPAAAQADFGAAPAGGQRLARPASAVA